ncbi:MAG TPA: acetate--CoA ligase family protein [Acidimicrobiales bacterium]|nr:acetate--CoA ligase family protein [Acidimicrobiales bacterium]
MVQGDDEGRAGGPAARTAEGAPDGARLERMFFPRRIVIAGLSPRADAWGRAALGFLRHAGFDGEVLALRPRTPDPAVASVERLADAGAVDLLVVAVPAEAAVEIIGEASASGVGGAVVFSAGFAEDGPEGAALQRRLVDAAGDMPLLGPNCLGLVSDPADVVVSVSGFLSRERSSGPVALVSQSGAMGFILAEHLRTRGVGFSYYASTGNEAVLGASELVSYLCRRPEVAVVGCYLEGVRDVAAWRSACRTAREHGCRVVALKVGSTEAAQRAALSHTASAAGEAELFEAVCREEGVTLVGDELAFAEAVCALANPVELPARPRFAVVTMSGGGGAMIADQLSPVADVPGLADDTRAGLHALGVALAGDANPVDLTGMFSRHIDRLDEVIDVVAADPSVDAVALYFTFGDRLLEQYRSLSGRLDKFAVPTWFVWAGAPAGEIPRHAATGRVVGSIPDLVRSVAAQPRRPAATVGDRPATPPSRPVAATGGSVVTEVDMAAELAALGLGYVTMAVGVTADAVLAEVDRLALPAPWVVKVDHPSAPHRARLGLLDVGVATPEALAASVSAMFERASGHDLAGARVVVEPLLSSVAAFSLGALRHADYGPVVLVGPGGEAVEAAGARRWAACLPLSDAGLAALTAGATAITGRPIDPDRLGAAVLAVEALMTARPDLGEVDVNPVLVGTDSRLVAVDALGVTAAPPNATNPVSVTQEGPTS